jgi:transcriptional regulator with XRE-family HTH domain
MAKSGPSQSDREIGARIRLRRKALGVTQIALADALGVTFQQVQKYEKGVNRVAAGTLLKLAQRLDCPISYLLGEEGGGGAEQIPPSVMVTPGAYELLDAYSRIQSPETHAALLTIARSLQDRVD